ncbi:SPRY-domain-containing protein [Mycena maculata]|uniref:SPRY-domain-containing protein n=1 Tax=Mycena maculata TaxID=230809 RepID=A0AAD7IQL7_9AGAR|nr:SPRY-domain-containing protein [Mycena maculata]
MSIRQSRSPSIPIPRNSTSTSPTRNIESVISIPFTSSYTAPPRPRLASAQAIPISHHRSADDPRVSVRGVRNSASSISPTRPSVRSLSHSSPSIPVRSSPRSNGFEPRVIRADSPRSVDPACLPSSSSTSLPRPRRPSATGTRAPSTHNRTLSGPLLPAPPPRPASFTRPAYLEHSALRHMLQTEMPPSLPPSRKSGGSRRSMSPTTDSDEDGSPPPRRVTPTADPSPQVLNLPTRWSEHYRHELLTISPDGRDVTYQGASCNGDKDAAAVRTTHPIPPACGIYYYEVEILCKGNKGHISIGFAAKDVKLTRLPGWEQNSWGYHGDDGRSFATEKNGTPFGPTFGTGDTIGCGIDFSTYQAFFTKNGTLIGSVFKDIGKTCDIYPSIGLRHSGEAVRVNFGQDPFKFDIEYHVHQQRIQTWSNILTTPIDPSLVVDGRFKGNDGVITSPKAKGAAPVTEEQTKSAIDQLVLSYLTHHGYSQTARAFQKQCLGSSGVSSSAGDHDVDMDGSGPSVADGFDGDMELRTQIVNSVVAGDIDTAMLETKKHYPSVLEADEGLMLFKLRCRKFIELLLDATELHKKMKTEEVADDDEMGMDVDDDAVPLGSPVSPRFSPKTRRVSFSLASSKAQVEHALNLAIIYGQTLLNDYTADERPEVQALFKRTVGIVAWHDPIEHGGVAAEVAGSEARVELANELNQAILRSQGRPANPVLETIYRHTAVCVHQLGVSGVGAAAFADMQKEFIEG